MAHAGGRPLEYNFDELKPKIEQYLESCVDVYNEDTKRYDVKLPTIEGLSLALDIAKVTVFDWEDKYPEFSYFIDKLRAKQAEKLLNKGLSGDYNPTISKVLLTKHGYREGIENTGKDGERLIPEVVTQEQKTELLSLLNGNDKTSTS